MKILVTGRDGQVGWELCRTLPPLGQVIATGRDALDLADPDRIRAVVREHAPDGIVNAAAYTAVDRAEQDEPLAARINGEAPGILAEEAQRAGAWLIHYSTDYVFDGAKPEPYTEEDPPAPLGAYGRTKLAGEVAVRAVGGAYLILRTSWVYGRRGRNFLNTILRLAREQDSLRIVSDQIGAPTWCRAIAEATTLIVERSTTGGGAPGLGEMSGLYHLAAGGEANWCEFARAILEHDLQRGEHRARKIIPILTAQYPTAAQRPLNSRLDCSAAAAVLGVRLAPWDEALRQAMETG